MTKVKVKQWVKRRLSESDKDDNKIQKSKPIALSNQFDPLNSVANEDTVNVEMADDSQKARIATVKKFIPSTWNSTI